MGDLEEKGARRDQELPRNEYCRRLVAFRPSRGSPVELPWNENRRHFDAVWSRGMMGRRWNCLGMKIVVIWRHIGLVD